MTRTALCALAVASSIMAGCSEKRRDPPPPPPPIVSIASVSPVSGTTLGGTTLTITGTAFTAGATVTVQGTAATGVSVASSVQLTCTTPLGTAGPADVVVTAASGAGTAVAGFTYLGGPAPAPTITGVSPTSGATAGGTTVTLTGSGFQTGATVTVGGAAATGVTVNTAGSLVFTTPAGTAGNTTVVVTNPDTQSATLANGFVYGTPTPIVSAINPTSGPVAGGTRVTLTGTGFLAGGGSLPSIAIGGVACTGVVVQHAAQCTATTGASGVVGPQTVQLTNPGGSSGSLANGFSYIGPIPTVTGLAPSNGPQPAGTVVTITGTGFYPGATVLFGGSAATGVTVNSGTQIIGTAPAGTGTVTVTVTNRDGNSATGSYTYDPPPSVGAIAPVNGPATIASAFTITGSNFVTGATVDFGGSPATGLTVAAGSITGTTPLHAPGLVTVTVTNPDGQSATTSYTFDPAPSITLINPSNGPATIASAFTITGSNFAGSAVTFGASAATGLTVTPTQITGTTPTGTGTVTVTVTNGDGQVAATSYTYDPPPSISGISPTNGAPAGGNAFTITGAAFVSGAGVTFGVNAVTGPTVGATQITGSVPAGAVGGVTVTVTNPDGQSATTSYTYNPAPGISGIAPGNGPATIPSAFTITGSNFMTGATVDFGGGAATGLTVAAGSITGTTPLHAPGLVTVTLTNPDGQTATTSYTFDPPPSISAIAPTNGPGLGGAAFTITGSAFVGGATVDFGGSLATGLTVAAGQIDGITPAGSGTVTVTVTNPDGQSATTSYTYNPPPTLTSITPTSGPSAGGNAFTIAGGNFLAGATVTFGANAVSSPSVAANQITGTVPAWTSGPYAVTVTVTNPDGQAVTTTYTYMPPPTVTSIAPTSGPELGGQRVTIDGAAFVSGATVMIGGNTATGVSFVNTTRLTAVTPAGLAGVTVNVTVTNPDTQLGTLFTAYTYRAAQTHVLTGATDWQLQDREGTDHTRAPGSLQLALTAAGFAGDGAVVTVVAYDANSTQRLLVGTAGAGAFLTTNGGSSWTPFNRYTSPALPSNHVLCAEFHSPTGGTGRTFGIGTDAGAAVTHDGGQSFRVFTTSSVPRLEGPRVEGIDFYDGNAAPTHLLFAANSGTNLGGGGVHYSVDGGATFAVFNGLSTPGINGNYVRDVAFGPNSGSRFLVASYAKNVPDANGDGGTGGIYLTTDGGQSFTRFSHVSPTPIASRTPSQACASVAFDPSDVTGATWLAGFDTHLSSLAGAYYTANDGVARTLFNTGSGLPSDDVRDVAFGGTSNQRWLAATEAGLALTVNGGTAFSTFTTASSPSIASNFVNDVAWVPAAATFAAATGAFTATTAAGGCDQTTDTGGTFATLPLPAPDRLPHANVRDVAVFDGDGTGNRILVATGMGAALTLDGGQTWTGWSTSSSPALPSNDVRAVAWYEGNTTGTNAVLGTAAGAVVVTGIGSSPAFTVLNSGGGLVSNDVLAVDYFSGSTTVTDDLLVGTTGGLSYVTGALGSPTYLNRTTASSPSLPSNTVNAVAFFHGQTASTRWAAGTAGGLVLTQTGGTSVTLPTLPGGAQGQIVRSVAYWNGGTTGNEILAGTQAGAALNTGGGTGSWTAFTTGNGLLSNTAQVVKFLDAGASASTFAVGCARVQLAPGPPPVIQAGGLVVTTNQGASFAVRRGTGTMPSTPADDVIAFDFDDSVSAGDAFVLGCPAVVPTDTGGLVIERGVSYRASGTGTVALIEGGVLPRASATAPTWDDRFTRGVAYRSGSTAQFVVGGPYGVAATVTSGTAFTVATEATSPALLSSAVLAVALYNGDTNGTTWIAATPAALYLTTNGGGSYTAIGTGNGLPTMDVRGIAFHHGVASAQVFAVATSLGLAITRDGGVSFTVFAGGSGLANDCRDVDFFDGNATSGSIRCAVATSSGVWVCTNLTTGAPPTATFAQRTVAGNGLASNDCWAVRYDENDGSGATFWAGTWFTGGGANGGLSRTTNHGGTFTNSLPFTFVWDIDVHPSLAGNVIAGLVQGVAVTTNGGGAWTVHTNQSTAGALPATDCHGVSFAGTTAGAWLAATEEGLVVTTNGTVASPTFTRFRKGATTAYSRLRVTETLPANTSIRYQVLDRYWVPIPDAVLAGNSTGLAPDASGVIDLRLIPVGTYPVIQVRAILSTTAPASTPQLQDLTLIYEY